MDDTYNELIGIVWTYPVGPQFVKFNYTHLLLSVKRRHGLINATSFLFPINLIAIYIYLKNLNEDLTK